MLGLDHSLWVPVPSHELIVVQLVLEGLAPLVVRHQNKKACEELLAAFCLHLRLDSNLDGEVRRIGHVDVIKTALVHDLLAG